MTYDSQFEVGHLAHSVQAQPEADSWVSLDAPWAPASEVMRLEGAEVAWVPPDDESPGADERPYGAEHCVGFGAARRFTASGAERFERVEAAVRECFAQLRPVSSCEGRAVPPRVFGGFAFRAGDCEGNAWQPFGDAQFVLPRMLYAQSGQRATLSVWVGREHSRNLDAALRRALVLRAQIAELAAGGPASAPRSEAPSRRAQRVRQVVTREQWTELVDAVLAEIRAGRSEKIVAARVAELQLDGDISVPDTLAALGFGHPTATRFAFSVGGATFLGATPEQLISKRGLQLRSEALAGTFRKQSTAFAAELLRSPKEHEEHQPVLETIVRTLGPLCSALQYSNKPQLRELRNLLHLQTPIVGQLKEPLHVLQLVRALHPTPAVGGVPQQPAIDWIAEHELFPRGWYAGPVGWFDADGDGEFAVALRSGLVQGDKAVLHSGAGIVRGSEPDLEFEETELKLQALLGALRVRTR